jgi:hypothetical protein
VRRGRCEGQRKTDVALQQLSRDSGPISRALERTRKDPDELSLQEHRRLIGYLGLALPVGLYLLAGIRPTPGLLPWDLLSSVSAYYYSGAVALFTGVLFALSLFLWSYKGYKDERADRVVGKVGGGAAALVALIPTASPTDPQRRPVVVLAWWRPWMDRVHYGSAVTLFVSFILFALWLFRKTAVVNRGDRPADKKRRDAVYLVCGVVMIGAVIWAGVATLLDRSIFWPEAIAIEAFAISWLTKGEAHEPLVIAAQRVLRHRK